MLAFDVYSWPALLFIVPVVSLLRFSVIERTRKDTPGSVAMAATASFSSLTLMKPVSPGLKSGSPKWLSRGRGSRYRQDTESWYPHRHPDVKKLSTTSNIISGSPCWRSAYMWTRRAMELCWQQGPSALGLVRSVERKLTLRDYGKPR